jgi:hypothetical protein
LARTLLFLTNQLQSSSLKRQRDSIAVQLLLLQWRWLLMLLGLLLRLVLLHGAEISKHGARGCMHSLDQLAKLHVLLLLLLRLLLPLGAQ